MEMLEISMISCPIPFACSSGLIARETSLQAGARRLKSPWRPSCIWEARAASSAKSISRRMCRRLSSWLGDRRDWTAACHLSAYRGTLHLLKKWRRNTATSRGCRREWGRGNNLLHSAVDVDGDGYLTIKQYRAPYLLIERRRSLSAIMVGNQSSQGA